MLSNQSSVELPISIKVPTIRILVSEPKVTITAVTTSVTATTVSCETINAELGQEASSSLSDLNFDFKSIRLKWDLLSPCLLQAAWWCFLCLCDTQQCNSMISCFLFGYLVLSTSMCFLQQIKKLRYRE